jgi:hypothetical protein
MDPYRFLKGETLLPLANLALAGSVNRAHNRCAFCEPSPGWLGATPKFSTSIGLIIMDAPQRAWIADPRTTCSLRYTRSAQLRTPRQPRLRACVQPTVALPPFGPSRINDELPVPKAAGPARRSRLALCRLSSDTLKLGLGQLAIPSLERIGAAGCVGVGMGSSQRARRVKRPGLSWQPVSGQHPLAP